MQSQQIVKPKNKFCIKPFKFCGSKKLSNDYECIPYDDKKEPTPIITTPIKTQKIENRTKLTKLNKLLRKTAKGIHTPEFHSTKVEQTIVYESLHQYITKTNKQYNGTIKNDHN